LSRISGPAAHSRDDLDRGLRAFEDAGKALGVI